MALTEISCSTRRASWGCPRLACRAKSSRSSRCLFSAPAKPIIPRSRCSPNRRWPRRVAEPLRRNLRSFEAEKGKTAMHWLWVIIIGFIAGAIAKLFIAGPGGFIVTTLLGIVGAIFATWLGQQIGWYRPGQGAGFIGAIVGAVLILAIYRAIVGAPP